MTRRTSRRRGALLGGLLVSMCAACGIAQAPSGTAGGSAGDELMVFAAASLRTPFTAIGAEFETEHPGTTVRFTFAGSADLASQIEHGAPADVFASAAQTNMDAVVSAGLVSGSPRDFAMNSMEIAVPSGNPASVTGFLDLANPDLRVVVCAPVVPCGSGTRSIEQATGVTLNPVSEESSVTDVLNKVASGEADAGVVYTTDVLSARDRVDGVAIPNSPVNTYSVAVLRDQSSTGLGREFAAAVLGSRGQRILATAGFGAPDP